jgi:hypothetical protein
MQSHGMAILLNLRYAESFALTSLTDGASRMTSKGEVDSQPWAFRASAGILNMCETAQANKKPALGEGYV